MSLEAFRENLVPNDQDFFFKKAKKKRNLSHCTGNIVELKKALLELFCCQYPKNYHKMPFHKAALPIIVYSFDRNKKYNEYLIRTYRNYHQLFLLM